MPVSGNIMLDKKKAMELVDQMRLSIPQEVKAAIEVLGQKDQIVNQATLDARRTKSDADQEYRQRMDQSELVVSAEARAQDTLRDAEQRASRLLHQSEAESTSRRSDADAYALRSLRALEQEISAIAGSYWRARPPAEWLRRTLKTRPLAAMGGSTSSPRTGGKNSLGSS